MRRPEAARRAAAGRADRLGSDGQGDPSRNVVRAGAAHRGRTVAVERGAETQAGHPVQQVVAGAGVEAADVGCAMSSPWNEGGVDESAEVHHDGVVMAAKQDPVGERRDGRALSAARGVGAAEVVAHPAAEADGHRPGVEQLPGEWGGVEDGLSVQHRKIRLHARGRAEFGQRVGVRLAEGPRDPRELPRWKGLL
jgi:hypothetical protein